MSVVETLDEFEDGHPSLGLSAELIAIEQFALEGGEEAFGHGVVEAVADRSHRRAHAGLPAALAERNRSVLAALIGMVHDIERTAPTERHIEGIEHRHCAQVRGHGPPDDAAAEDIEHHRQIEEARPCPTEGVQDK